MPGGQNKYSGNILLYDYLSSHRAPVFLQRNITRALRIHQQLLQKKSTQALINDYHQLRQPWQTVNSFFSWDILDAMMAKQAIKKEFVLDIHSVKLVKDQPRGPAREIRTLMPKDIDVSLWFFGESAGTEAKHIAPQSVVFRAVSTGNERKINVEAEPIRVKASVLVDENVSADSKLDYKMKLYIQLHNKHNAREMYYHLSPGGLQKDKIKNRWKASWQNILNCPEGRTVLPLEVSKESDKSDIGVEVSMGWLDHGNESPLASVNQMMRPASSIPPPLPPPAHPEARYKLYFAYERKTLKQDGLVCPHHVHLKFDDIDALQVHLRLSHASFEYGRIGEGVDDEGVQRYKFNCKIADISVEQRASAQADEPYDINHIAPSLPFDRQEFSETGSNEFLRRSRFDNRRKPLKPRSVQPRLNATARKHKSPDQVRDRPARIRPKFRVPEAPPGIVFVRSSSRRTLTAGEEISESDDDVDEEWTSQRISAEYNRNDPLPENMRTFLKTFDEHMREEQLNSDIHFSDALIRFVRGKATWLWQAELCEVFQDKLEQLLDDGIIVQEIRDACLSMLEKAKPIQNGTSQTIDTSRPAAQQNNDDLYRDPTPPPSTSPVRRSARSSSRRKAAKGKGKARMTNNGQLTPSSDADVEMSEAPAPTATPTTTPEANNPPPFDLCLCGSNAQDIYSASQLVACSSVGCIRGQFHYSCLQKHWNILSPLSTLRKRDWVCQDCLSNTRPRVLSLR